MDWLTDSKLLDSHVQKSIIKNDRVHCIKAKQLSELVQMPKDGEQYRIVTEKQFNAYSFILNVLESGDIESLHVAIYRINEPSVRSLIGLIESGRIKQATFIISDFFNQTKRPEQWSLMLRRFCENRHDCKHTYINNHAKIICIKQGDNHYTFEGSGNISDNARIEQYIIENNKKTYAFHTTWMNKLVA